MKIHCSQCKAAYEINESKIPEKGIRKKCRKRGNPIWIEKQGVLNTSETSPSSSDDGRTICKQCGQELRQRIQRIVF